jgi:hypothetical protein
MLFQFQLRPIEKVTPWGREGAYSLSWFGLTDGWYWLKCGEEELFRYSESVLSSCQNEERQPSDPPYVDYQVVRLWEDVLSMFPEVLAPVPVELLRKVEPGLEVSQWRAKIAELFFSEEHEASRQTEDQFDLAVTWLQARKLHVLHLKEGPRVWFWTDGMTMSIRWDNSGLCLDGHSMWTSTKGTFTMPLEAFVEEVRSFDNRLIKEMADRVRDIEHSWDRPEIQIDLQALCHEHQQRAAEFSLALDRAINREPTPWNEIAQAINYFEEMGCVLPEAG